jgi:hypothetical protein
MLSVMKSRSDRRGQDVSLSRYFATLRAAAEVMFHCLPFVGGESVKDIIIEDFFCQVSSSGIRSSVLPSECGFRGNPAPFDTFRVSKRMPLTREDGGTGATGNQMIY